MSRGSDVAMHSLERNDVITSKTGELKFEEAEEVEEANDGEMKETIIYLPPSQDDFDSEVARLANVQYAFFYIRLFLEAVHVLTVGIPGPLICIRDPVFGISGVARRHH